MSIFSEVKAAVEMFGKVKDRRLKYEERRLLLAAASDEGDFVLIQADGGSPWVHAGNEHFVQQHDPSYSAYYMTAFCNLIRKGLVRQNSERHFSLTGDGWTAAKKLQANG